LILSAAVASALWLWGFRGLSPVAAFYARVQRIGTWLGVRPHASQTPVEYARDLGQAVPVVRGPTRVLAALYETEQYGRRPVTETEAATGQSAWREMRRSLVRGWRPRRRGGSKEKRHGR
jgi:hypothetical protein